MEERTDQAWVRELKAEDTTTIHDLWQMVFHFAWQAARKQNASEDMAHEAAIAAYNRIRQRGVNQYKYSCPFPGYCRVIVVRELLRLYRKQPKAVTAFDEEVGTTASRDEVAINAPIEMVKERLHYCLEKLPLNVRVVIELLYFQSVAPEDAAQQLKIRRNYVNQLAHRARKRLKACLEAQGYLTVEDVLNL